MMNMNEEDVNLGIGSIRTRVINCSGAGVNAVSTRRELKFADCDPLSELVWSPQNGLGFKCVNSRPADKKPFMLWDVVGSRDEAAVDVFAELGCPGDCDDRESNGKMEEDGNEDANRNDDVRIAENTTHTADLQPQKVADDEASSAAATGAVNNNKTNLPISVLYPHVEISETKSRICLYKEKGKENVLSDEDDIHESVKSCNSAGLGIKRRGYGKDVMHASKRIKNQIPLCSGSTSIPRHGSSFMNWISNMVRGSTSFPLPLACSIDVNAKNLHENFNNGHDFASLNMGPQTVFQSLDMNILNTGEEKENDSVEECRQLIVEDTKTLDDLCLSKQIIECDRASQIPAKPFGETMNYAARKTSLEGTSDVAGKRNIFGSLRAARLRMKSQRSEKCQEIIQETIGCSTSCQKLNLDSGMNVVFPINQKSCENQNSSTNTEASVDLKSISKLCPIRRFGSSEAMTSVFARRVDALRHIIPSENIFKKDYQKLPLYDIVSAQNTVAMSEIFQAIRNLRLSRADILRWMNSDVSLSHLNGFFLRLRLRKQLDQGLEGATYYVACISAGDDREVNDCTSNKSISVDVGGIKSSITSQYVSNHDFLEDEIRAWWCKAVERGCRVPSIDELNSKFSYRTSLGL